MPRRTCEVGVEPHEKVQAQLTRNSQIKRCFPFQCEHRSRTALARNYQHVIGNLKPRTSVTSVTSRKFWIETYWRLGNLESIRWVGYQTRILKLGGEKKRTIGRTTAGRGSLFVAQWPSRTLATFECLTDFLPPRKKTGVGGEGVHCAFKHRVKRKTCEESRMERNYW